MKSGDDMFTSEINSSINTQYEFHLDVPNEVKRAINKAKEELDRGEDMPHHQVMPEIKTLSEIKYNTIQTR